MGHRIQTQNRGRGGPTYRAPSHLYRAAVHHAGRNDSITRGKVVDIEHDPARHGPVALVSLEDGRKTYVLATEGTGVGDSIAWGKGAEVKSGTTLPLSDIPVGAMISELDHLWSRRPPAGHRS